jgi:malonate transporter and related proteins
MALALLIAGMALAAVGYASARRFDPERWTGRALRTLFRLGAPASGVVAARTEVHAGLVVGIVAAWIVLAASAVAVLRLTQSRTAGERAELLLTVCWPNAAWLGFPVCVVVFGWGALPLAVAFSQLCTGPFTLVVLPGLVAALVNERADWLGRALAFARNPYLVCVSAGYALDAAGVAPPSSVTSVGRTILLVSTLPAFAAVGAVLAGHRLRVDTATVRLVTARLAVASVPLLALRALLPIPGPFVVSAGMAVGMGSFGVAAVYGVPTRRLAPALALSTALVLAAAAGVAVVRN